MLKSKGAQREGNALCGFPSELLGGCHLYVMEESCSQVKTQRGKGEHMARKLRVCFVDPAGEAD